MRRSPLALIGWPASVADDQQLLEKERNLQHHILPMSPDHGNVVVPPRPNHGSLVDVSPLGYPAQTEIVPGIPGLTPPQMPDIGMLPFPVFGDANKPLILTTPLHQNHATLMYRKNSSTVKHLTKPGSSSSTLAWTMNGRIKGAQLPNEGKIRFVPPKNYSPSMPLRKGPNGGYLDKFGNEWTKGPSRTAGQPFEWDVQLSPLGQKQLGWATRDGSHLNVSLDGRITHR